MFNKIKIIMELTAIFIVGFIVLGIYKLLELFVRKKERIMIIEKLLTLENKEASGSIHIPEISLGRQDLGSWPLRIALLLIGVGLGCIISFFIQHCLYNSFVDVNMNDWKVEQNVSQIQFMLNFSLITIFGGIGLMIAYLIESKPAKK
jgi:hypothetical protein